MDPGARRDLGTLGIRLFGGQDRRIVSVNCRRQISKQDFWGPSLLCRTRNIYAIFGPPLHPFTVAHNSD